MLPARHDHSRRWLRARARGIASLLLTTTSEVSTTDDDSDDDSDQRISSTDLEHHREVFAALVASLAGTQVDLSVDFDDRCVLLIASASASHMLKQRAELRLQRRQPQ